MQAAQTFRGPSPDLPLQGPAQQREFLTFTLGSEHYAIDILKVQEIRGWEKPTAIANSPAFIKGVINLRGVIVPILDLRVKFNLADARYDEFTVVIILNIASRVVGVVVDSVSDVLALADEAIRPTPEFASATFDTRFITGLATVDEQLLVLLDIEKLMTSSDMALVDDATH
ncbi:chemotaxis protein CheW [Ramlibacter humi]|uniref:Chemotaxis protein CheW n=1 Tax=Ramlibacter humi TaxID=2530451 RepID=A0A4Z0BCV4_9BURK|nr:chemotaxis protein CheW [Ramlibacter humi]TFY96189.1 chemotaxis protein CheW [Ramlibacter humi]